MLCILDLIHVQYYYSSSIEAITSTVMLMHACRRFTLFTLFIHAHAHHRVCFRERAS